VTRVVGLAVVAALIALAGCGGSSSSTGGGKSIKAAAAPAPKATGNVTWCIGKDTTGAFSTMVSRFNQQNPKAHLTLLELPTSADQQRAQLIQRLRAKSSECDVLGMDVVWTAEFAGQNWLKNVSDLVAKRQGAFIPSTLKTAQFEGKTWAVPFNTNAGFLYYRTDMVNSPPTTWQQVYSEAKSKGGIVYQGSQYEGLTVNYLELLYSAGGKVVDTSGTKLDFDKNKAAQVLSLMASGIKDGAAPRAVTTYMEEESRRAFESGKPAFMRNWPYAYVLDKKASIGPKFAVAPLPGWQGGKAASVLGGYNLGISAYSKNPAGAAAFINFATQPAQQLVMGVKAALPPVLGSVYDNPQLKKAMPFTSELKKAIEQGEARPVSPVYPQISQAIYKNAFSAIQGRSSPQAAANAMSSQIQSALKTF
jgi:multiple sugar transport system substrate-binding protein